MRTLAKTLAQSVACLALFTAPAGAALHFTRGPLSTNVTSDSAAIEWDTSDKSDSTVHYGTKQGQYDGKVSDATPAIAHRVALMALEDGQTYYYVAVSSDGQGHSITSQPSSFQTDSGAADVWVHNFAFADDKTMEFRMDASGNVKRVEFYLDGELFGIDYTAPYRAYLDPPYAGIPIAELASEHMFMARAFNDQNEWQTMASPGSLIMECFETMVDITVHRPYRWFTIFTDTDVAPATNVPMVVEAYERGTRSEACRANPGFPRIVPTNIPPRCVEFYLDRDLLHTTSNGVPGDATRFEYTVDCTGISTGSHALFARVITENGCPFGKSAELLVERRLPTVRVRRTVYRGGTEFACRLDIENVGDLPVRLERVVDSCEGFQIYGVNSHESLDVSVSYNPVDKRCTAEARFTGLPVLEPSNTVTVSYSIMPILYRHAVTYEVGGEGRLEYRDTYASYTEDLPFTTPIVSENGETNGIASSVRAAFAAANYVALTNPRNLFARNDTDDVNELLCTLASLCLRNEGVLAYYFAYGFLAVEWNDGDLLAAGNIFTDSGDELVVGDVNSDRIRIYNQVEEKTVTHEDDSVHVPIPYDLYAGDALAMGNTIPTDIDSADHWRKEIVLARGSGHGAWEGYVRNFSYEYVPGSRDFTETTFATAYNDGDGFAVGNILSEADPVAEIVVANADGSGRIWVYSHAGTPELPIDSGFRTGDALIVGNVYAEGPNDQILAACFGSDQIEIYDAVGSPTPATARDIVPCDLDSGDAIGVGDVWGDANGEIVVTDASEDRIRIYEYDSVRREIQFLRSFPFDIEPGDRVVVAPLFGGAKAQIIIPREDTSLPTSSGRADVITFFGGRRPGDAWDIDRFLDENEYWSRQLAEEWDRLGYLLIVGETDIIPSFTDEIRHESCERDIGLTDQRYASTVGSRFVPEIRMGRIVGDTAVDLLTAINNILDVRRGLANFANDSALIVSGHADGVSGTSDHIDFTVDADQAEAGILDAGFAVERHDTSDGSGFDEAAFFAAAVDTDLIFITGHGNVGVWDILSRGDVDAQFNPGTCRPLVYAASCLTGRFADGRSLAEAFIQGGASAYVGATEVGLWNYGRALGEQFFGELDRWTPIGEALMRAKQTLGSMGEGGERKLYKYNSAVFGLCGDPAMEFVYSWALDDGALRDGSVPQTLNGPVTTLDFTVPDCVFTNDGTHDHVTIPGHPPVLELGKPIVPGYSTFVTYPPGYRVQDVVMSKRDGSSSGTGLDLPLVELLEPENQARAGATPEAADWWPDRDYEWSVERLPGGESRLHIRACPFFYDGATTDWTFYTNYSFDITTTRSFIAINRIIPDRDTYAPGDTIEFLVYFENTATQATDIVLTPRILDGGGAVHSAMNPATLKGVRGMCSYSCTWNTDGESNGTYSIEITLESADTGNLLDCTEHDFELGRRVGHVTDLTVTPPNFGVGDDVDLAAQFFNSGDSGLSGTFIILVRGVTGEVLAVFRKEFVDLAPGKTVAFSTTWTDADVVARNCRISAYVLFDGDASDIVTDKGWADADLLIREIAPLNTKPCVEWWSLPGYVYDILFSSNLVQQGLSCIASNIEASPPLNTYTGAPLTSAGFYRVRERPAP